MTPYQRFVHRRAIEANLKRQLDRLNKELNKLDEQLDAQNKQLSDFYEQIMRLGVERVALRDVVNCKNNEAWELAKKCENAEHRVKCLLNSDAAYDGRWEEEK